MTTSSSTNLFIYINLSIIGLAAVIFGYWYFIDGTVVNVPIVDKTDAMDIRTDKMVYSPGEEITVYNSFCKYTSLPSKISAQLVDGEIISMSTRESNLPPGCYGVEKPFSVNITKIPTVISPGKWHLRWTVTYQVNPIKQIVYTRKTHDFEIRSPMLPIPI